MPEPHGAGNGDAQPQLDEMFAPPPGSLKREPRHRIVARMAGPDEAEAAVAALVGAGFPPDDVYVVCGEEGARRLDPTGRHHGLRGRLVRAVQTIFAAEPVLADDASHLEHGGVIVTAPAREQEERTTATQILRNHGGTEMRYYGDRTWEDIG
jgi:hypothetical protein